MSSSRRVAVGIHACKEILKVRPHKVSEIWILSKANKKQALREIEALAKQNSISVREKSEAQMSKIAVSHQGVAVFVEETPKLSWNILGQPSQPDSELLLALDGVTDPHNLGAVMRTAWLMGALGILVSESRGSLLVPSAHKVACGAAEHLFVDGEGSLYQRLLLLKDKGFWVFGLDSEKGQELWSENKWPQKLVLVLGSEGKGLRSSTRKACDEFICLPQKEASASYNVSVAASLAIAEYVRRQKNLKNI